MSKTNTISNTRHCIHPIKILFALSMILSVVITLLSGCATAGKNTLPQTGDMTMAEIYQQQTGLDTNLNGDEAELIIHSEMDPLKALPSKPFEIQKSSSNIASPTDFKPLPNPEIPIYIYPHLVNLNGESQPVPAYTTAFFLYRENHFAEPGEVY